MQPLKYIPACGWNYYKIALKCYWWYALEVPRRKLALFAVLSCADDAMYKEGRYLGY